MSIAKKYGDNWTKYYDTAYYGIMTFIMILTLVFFFSMDFSTFIIWFFIRVGIAGTIGEFIGKKIPIGNKKNKNLI